VLGVHHAGTGAAVWVAVTASSPAVPALGISPLDPAAVAIGGLVTAGAALLPDADHPSATISYAVPVLGRTAARAVSAASGGHRNGTHSAIAAVAVVWLAWWLTTESGLVDASPLSAYTLCAGAAAAALLAFAVKVLRIVRRWGSAWLIGIASSALITLLLPAQWAWLPWAIAIGWVAHLAGDLLTTGGLPLLWPLPVGAPRFIRRVPLLNEVWSRGGYVALPVLGLTGSWRETWLAAPLTLYALYGVVASAIVAVLP
jgi:membrane-bound metal-dependent hydrolase YbcI (DUF457 family)